MPDDKFKPCKTPCSSVEFSEILNETRDLNKEKEKEKEKKKKKKKNKNS